MNNPCIINAIHKPFSLTKLGAMANLSPNPKGSGSSAIVPKIQLFSRLNDVHLLLPEGTLATA
ncbi:hypothetical protein [Shewanella subflava]|uniref:Uncharacterized protein n=1 Tax=Shewanella subflava TaxID=2986476 RepID=A0ABT3IDB1_9GAMM|nr:hypothetical protein [Shewanella subflava]MCW3174048.1 hypothetical protein [Shewanella subflava]